MKRGTIKQGILLGLMDGVFRRQVVVAPEMLGSMPGPHGLPSELKVTVRRRDLDTFGSMDIGVIAAMITMERWPLGTPSARNRYVWREGRRREALKLASH